MGLTGGGAGVMLALAAVLWLVYLIPSWFRRREYMATERNAVRLQQTLRIMAESSEVPEVVTTESTARGIAEQRRALRLQTQQAEAVARARAAADARAAARAAVEAERELQRQELRRAAFAAAVSGAEPSRFAYRTTQIPVISAEQAAAHRSAIAEPPSVSAASVSEARRRQATEQARLDAEAATARARLRRSRAVASLLLLAGLGTGAVQGSVVLSTGASAGAWVVLGGAGAAVLLAVGVLQRLAAVSRARGAVTRVAARVPVARASVAVSAEESREWTPVPLPKPLYMSKPEPQQVVMADPREHERVAAARDAGEVTVLGAHAVERAGAAPEAAPQDRAARVRNEFAQATPTPSPYAKMGLVDYDDVHGATDVNAVLQRRRVVNG
jgi:hypothetical protein